VCHTHTLTTAAAAAAAAAAVRSQIQAAGDGSTQGLIELQGQLSAKEAEVQELRAAVEEEQRATEKVRDRGPACSSF